MRLVLPIGSPEFIGSINYRLAANPGQFLMVGKDATLIYQPGSTGTFDPRTLNATNTGAVLGGTIVNSSVTAISTPGTYTNTRFTNGLTVNPTGSALNGLFLFRNCIFQGSQSNAACYVPDDHGVPTNIQFEYCDFNFTGGANNGMAGAPISMTRCFFRGWQNCINVYDPMTITECANDGIMRSDDPNAHYDCIENNGAPNCLIQRCKWINNLDQTSAIMLNNFGGSCSNTTVDNCYLEGGGYTCYADNSFNTGAGYSMTNIRFTRNIIKPGFWGAGSFYTSDVYFPTTGADANTIL